MKKFKCKCIVSLCLVVVSAVSFSDQLSPRKLQKLGLDSARLEKVDAFIGTQITEQKRAGAVVLISRRGKIAHYKAYGKNSIENNIPMQRDDIFRVFSMSKIITSVAVLQLLEGGLINLDDPVSEYLPPLANMKVMINEDVDKPELVAPKSPLTIRHLLTHTAGIPYAFPPDSPVAKVYSKEDPLTNADSLENFIERLGSLPLAHEPGGQWTYGMSTAVLGRLIEVVSETSFDDYLLQYIFGPLGMRDTFFSVPKEKQHRLVGYYTTNDKGVLETSPFNPGLNGEMINPFPAGGEGLFSTAADYARFGQMLLNGGRLGEVRIIGRKAVELMRANQLSHLPFGSHGFSTSEGFGLGVSVMHDLGRHTSMGSEGQYGWNGFASTMFLLDPKEELVVLILTQQFPYDQHKLFSRIYNVIMSSLID